MDTNDLRKLIQSLENPKTHRDETLSQLIQDFFGFSKANKTAEFLQAINLKELTPIYKLLESENESNSSTWFSFFWSLEFQSPLNKKQF